MGGPSMFSYGHEMRDLFQKCASHAGTSTDVSGSGNRELVTAARLVSGAGWRSLILRLYAVAFAFLGQASAVTFASLAGVPLVKRGASALLAGMLHLCLSFRVQHGSGASASARISHESSTPQHRREVINPPFRLC
jgi:hypothetical protein